MHWINFPLIVIMIWSGLRIYWAEDVYAFGILDWEWFKFFPESFYESLDLNRHLARGLAFHFNFAWLFTINGLAFVIYTWRTGEWRELAPNKRSLRGSLDVLLHDLRIRKEEPAKRGRYNEAQRVTYSLVIVLGSFGCSQRLCNFQTNPSFPVDLDTRRLHVGPNHPLRGDHRLRAVLCRPYLAGGASRVAQLHQHGHRLRVSRHRTR